MTEKTGFTPEDRFKAYLHDSSATGSKKTPRKRLAPKTPPSPLEPTTTSGTVGFAEKSIKQVTATQGGTKSKIAKLRVLHEVDPVTQFKKACKDHTPVAAKAMLDGAKIETVDLFGIPLTVKNVRNLVATFPNVRTLCVRGCDLSDEALLELTKLGKLTSLDIGDNKRISGKGFLALAKFGALDTLQLGSDSLKAFEGLMSELVQLQFEEAAKGRLQFEKKRNELYEFLKQCPSQQVVTKIVAALKKGLAAKPETAQEVQEKALCNVFKRAEEIARAEIEVRPLLPLACLRLAIFIEVYAESSVNKVTNVFTKHTDNLPRTVQYSQEEKAFYVAARSRFTNPKIKGVGSFKVVSAAALLRPKEYSQAPHLFARAVTLGGSKATKRNIDLAVAEAARTRQVVDKIHEPLGIVPVHTVSTFNDKLGVPRVSIISSAFDGSLKALYESPQRLSPDNFLRIAKGTAAGLRQLHSLNFVHLDVKPGNAVYRQDPHTNNIQEARLIDLGLSCSLNKGEPRSLAMITGFYGSPGYTSPEQLSDVGFKGDFKKTDVFAFGVMLYQLHYKADPPWFVDIENRRKKIVSQDDAQRIVKAKIRNTIENRLAHFKMHPPQTKEEAIECLICKTLQVDPKARITMQMVCEELEKIDKLPSAPVHPEPRAVVIATVQAPRKPPVRLAPITRPVPLTPPISAPAPPAALLSNTIFSNLMKVDFYHKHALAKQIKGFADIYQRLVLQRLKPEEPWDVFLLRMKGAGRDIGQEVKKELLNAEPVPIILATLRDLFGILSPVNYLLLPGKMADKETANYLHSLQQFCLYCEKLFQAM